MSETMYLQGAEEIGRAAATMRAAAEHMQAAAHLFNVTVDQHERFLIDWLMDFTRVIGTATDATREQALQTLAAAMRKVLEPGSVESLASALQDGLKR